MLLYIFQITLRIHMVEEADFHFILGKNFLLLNKELAFQHSLIIKLKCNHAFLLANFILPLPVLPLALQ